MLRNQTVLKKNNQDDLIFQIIDWHCNDVQFTVNNSDDENEDDEQKYKKKKNYSMGRRVYVKFPLTDVSSA